MMEALHQITLAKTKRVKIGYKLSLFLKSHKSVLMFYREVLRALKNHWASM